MRHIDKIDSDIECGVTRPYRGFIGNTRGIIKISNTNYGVKVLINELISYYLAQILDIKIPDGELCIIDDVTEVDLDLEYCLSEEMIDIKGVAFFSTELMLCDTFRPTIEVEYLENKDEINKIILFDYLLHNRDRHEQNLLLNMSNGYMYIIDHSHILNCKGSNMWTAECLREYIINEDFKDSTVFDENIKRVYNPFIMANIVNIEKMKLLVKVFQKNITKEKLLEFIKKLPTAWQEEYKEDIDMFIKYILYRLEHIHVAVDIIQNVVLLERGFVHEN